MRAARATILVLAGLAALGLAGCSSGAPEASAASPRASLTAAQVKPSPEPTLEPAGLELTADNLVDVVTGRMVEAGSVHLAMTSEAGGVSFEGDVEYTGQQPHAHLTMTTPDVGELEFVVFDGVTYVKMGARTRGKFAVFDEDDPSNPFADITESMSPTGTVESLAGAITSVTRTGETETLGDVQVHAFRVVVDRTRVDTEQRALDAADAPASLESTYWIDDDGYLQRVVADVLGVGVVVTYSDWGQDFGIEPPAKKDLTDDRPF